MWGTARIPPYTSGNSIMHEAKKRTLRNGIALLGLVAIVAVAPYLYVWLTEPVTGCLRADAWGPPAFLEGPAPVKVGVWNGWFIWAFIAAELGIFVPYTWIPVSLGRVLRGRKDIPFGLLV